MNHTPRLPLPWALLASVAVHVLFLVEAWSARSSATPTQPPAPPEKDAWAASSVEVGTVANEPGAASSPPPVTPSAPTEQQQNPVVSPPSARPSPKPAASARIPRAPAPSSAPASTALASAAADSTPVTSAGSLGAVGLPPGVRHLAKAFARALPEGGHRDRAWSELPLGPVGRAVLVIHVDAEGHLERAEFDPAIPTPAPLKRMIERTMLLLKAGTFSLDKKSVRAGVERLSLDVTLTQESTDPDQVDAPHLMAQEGHQAPEPERAGYARFTLNSGRHMEAVLKLLAR